MVGKEAVPEPTPSLPLLDNGKNGPRRRSYLFIGGAVAILAVLALALGLGLGLGLRSKKHSNAPSAATPSAVTPGNGTNSSTTISDSHASPYVPPWRMNTEDYILDMTDWDLNAPPTTRIYNFTFSEVDLAPDGRILEPRARLCLADY